MTASPLTEYRRYGGDPSQASEADRAGIVDALYRFAAGQDLRDRALFRSAFSDDATLDFTGPARRLGAAMPVLEGGDAIAELIFASIAGLDTSHSVSNPRVRVDADGTGSLLALVEAQHLPRGDHSRHLLLKNVYGVDLVRDREPGRWRMRHLRIDTIWLAGDPAVLFPPPG